jgi:hypothetical protein
MAELEVPKSMAQYIADKKMAGPEGARL